MSAIFRAARRARTLSAGIAGRGGAVFAAEAFAAGLSARIGVLPRVMRVSELEGHDRSVRAGSVANSLPTTRPARRRGRVPRQCGAAAAAGPWRGWRRPRADAVRGGGWESAEPW